MPCDVEAREGFFEVVDHCCGERLCKHARGCNSSQAERMVRKGGRRRRTLACWPWLGAANLSVGAGRPRPRPRGSEPSPGCGILRREPTSTNRVGGDASGWNVHPPPEAAMRGASHAASGCRNYRLSELIL